MRRHVLIQLALIIALAGASAYRLPDLQNSNWQTVLFLTPLGIIQNHLDTRSVIRTFYSEVSAGQLALSPTSIALMVAIYAAMAGNAWFAFRKTERRGR